MITLQNRLLLGAALLAAACAHPELTGQEHRRVAAEDEARAAQEKALYDPQEIAKTPSSHGPSDVDAAVEPHFYNPSAEHLAEADRLMRDAFAHLAAAHRLDNYEDAACAGISQAERMACPLVAPHLDRVEELGRGIALHLKSTAPASTLATQMRCHLAFAQANSFEYAPCPLYLKGVTISLRPDKTIEVAAISPKIAATVRSDARKMFGEPAVEVKP